MRFTNISKAHWFLANAIFLLTVLSTTLVFAQANGPADALWELYKEGNFAEVVVQGKLLINTDKETAQVNLAVGRSLVHLEKYDDSFVYLTKAVQLDSDKTWVYAWGQVYLGMANWKMGDYARAGQAFILARDCNATRNATRNATTYMTRLGLSESYANWQSFETDNFSFLFSDRLEDFDQVKFATRHEEAFLNISQWFGGQPDEKIRFLLYANQDEADEAGVGTLGFSKPTMFLTHARIGQTVGHEMTHNIAFHALNPQTMTGLINEGIAVHMDQTGRNQLKRARKARKDKGGESFNVSIPAIWKDWTLAPDEYSYPLAGAFVARLLEKGGKEKFFEFFTDQSYEHAQEIYGQDLNQWIREFEEDLYK